MSGIEPVAAFSLTCNILQVVCIGRETVRGALQVYHDGKIDHTLTENAAVLESLSREIMTLTTPVVISSSAFNYPTRQDKQLFQLAERCQVAVRDLGEEVDFLSGSQNKARSAAMITNAFKKMWRRSRLERLDQELREAEGLLQAGLLTTIYERCKKTNGALLSLRADLQSFIIEYCQRNAQLEGLVKKHITGEIPNSMQDTKAHVPHTPTTDDDSINHHIRQARKDETRRHEDARQDAQRAGLLQSLEYGRMNERRNQIREAHPKTFQWVLSDGSDGTDDQRGQRSDGGSDGNDTQSWDRFCDWLRSTEKVYWINGKPGSGKSTLIKHLLNELQTRKNLELWKTDPVVVSHFFWRPGPVMQHSIKGLLLSLLHQLASKDKAAVNQIIKMDEFRMLNKETETDWSENELAICLGNIMSCYSRPVVFFLDGLDEVLPDDGALRLLEVINRLSNIGDHKMCLGSRPEPIFVRELSSVPQFRLENLNKSDLQRYCEDNITIPPHYKMVMPKGFELPRYQGHCPGHYFTKSNPPSREDLHAWLVISLLEKADGVFLWVRLTVNAVNKALCKEETVEDLARRLDSLPGDMDASFWVWIFHYNKLNK
ncbi:uncharacterized protein PgNI_09115 [Pyricularia grisea]|uniref:Nephrocystin 3-like N-terminal domain-containing protein n=1 Tax=Pyricularia grisea TaxID=148305 RepID=A0A6P8ASA5_PYRGI|nr:uncharacterized protein PgNI_09115 [Pyricularia grisea]TLD05005.1 hypothetical protein PgNI_09115 [Pyricularia grisea]